MIHFSMKGFVTLCRKLIGGVNGGPQLFTDNEHVVDCPNCLITIKKDGK